MKKITIDRFSAATSLVIYLVTQSAILDSLFENRTPAEARDTVMARD